MIYKLKQEYPKARFALEKANYQSIYSVNTINELEGVVEKLGYTQPSGGSYHPAELMVTLGPLKVWGSGIFLMVLVLSFLHKNLSRLQKFLTITLACIPLVGIYLFFEATVGFVTVRSLPIYAGASEIYATGKSVPAGARLVGVLKGDWISLRSQSGEVFWAKSENLNTQCMLLWE